MRNFGTSWIGDPLLDSSRFAISGVGLVVIEYLVETTDTMPTFWNVLAILLVKVFKKNSVLSTEL